MDFVITGEDIRAGRHRTMMSQLGLARACGVDRGEVVKWEKGSPPTDPRVLLVLVRVLRFDLQKHGTPPGKPQVTDERPAVAPAQRATPPARTVTSAPQATAVSLGNVIENPGGGRPPLMPVFLAPR